ncbi:(2Fe-2S)-binding protein [Pseudomonas sp. 22373]|uniref:(2Fe-2S)-binding protein n=1 Tax=unclassified Pseudomonas TaxID=196821 RepID=UPI0024490555|nr:(2Fe-2S)-binding protein [Pseudomonas sp. GD03696]EKT4532747.1 (2Fe-2S)-binding protein [Pseudomonas putida]MDH1930953.1 (2Fe-2S)-binding protein [Pseudomonas sp. GD03696]
MATSPLFRSLDARSSEVVIEFDGKQISVADDTNLAAALLEAGVEVTRKTAVSGASRTAYCMMGVCFECLVEIDGVSRQACQVRTQAGLKVKTHCPAATRGGIHG